MNIINKKTFFGQEKMRGLAGYDDPQQFLQLEGSETQIDSTIVNETLYR
jgi:hypothetical protein